MSLESSFADGFDGFAARTRKVAARQQQDEAEAGRGVAGREADYHAPVPKISSPE